jgi:hypothetical protein
LRGRIWSQHLNPKYLETRPHKRSPEDKPQLSYGVLHNGRPAIEKSAFRKALARELDLIPGPPVVDFIRKNFELILMPLPDLTAEAIRDVEFRLIDAIIPLLNRAGNAKRRAERRITSP